MKVISAIHQVSVLRNRSRLAGLPIIPDEIWIHQILPYLEAEEETTKKRVRSVINVEYRSEYFWKGDRLCRIDPHAVLNMDSLIFAHYRCMAYHFDKRGPCGTEYPLIYNLHTFSPKHTRISIGHCPKNYKFVGVPEWAREEYQKPAPKKVKSKHK